MSLNQKSLQLPEEKKLSDNTELMKEFEQVKAQTATRIVNLILSICCGCGCLHYKVKREVPFDSPLKDGTGINEKQMLKGDMWSTNNGRSFEEWNKEWNKKWNK